MEVEGNCKPVLVIWIGEASEVHPTKVAAAKALGTSTTHLSRLIESGGVYRVGNRLCCVDELLEKMNE